MWLLKVGTILTSLKKPYSLQSRYHMIALTRILLHPSQFISRVNVCDRAVKEARDAKCHLPAIKLPLYEEESITKGPEENISATASI